MLRSLLVMILLLGVVGAVNSALAQQVDSLPDLTEYIVTADSANLRAEPNTSSAIVGTARLGESVFVYADDTESSDWLRVYQDGEEDAYIASFLVALAPSRFYDPQQEPILVVEGQGRQVSDVFEIPAGVYRVDAEVNDRSFILSYVTIAGECRDGNIMNDLNFDVNQLQLSALFVSQGCTVVFETDNVDSSWKFEIRDLLDPEFATSTTIEIEDGTQINGNGRALTMATVLPEGVWQLSAQVEDRSFILQAHPLSRDCDETSVFNELVDNAPLEASAIYRSGQCIVFWETSNVDSAWTITFAKLD